MRPLSRRLLVSAALCLGIALVSWAQAPLSAENGLLILANGQVLEGKIVKVGDHYQLTQGDSFEVHLRAADVEFCCRDLDEAYQRKRAALVNADVGEHLTLAQWCLSQDLLGYAAQEIATAIELDPRHPRIPLLERRLEVAREPKENKSPAGGAAEASLSSDDLDRMVRGMPSGTVEAFTHTIQPLLVNNCSTAGCHGPGSTTKYSLLRIPQGRTPSRRVTQRNLYATLKYVNSSDPILSALLQEPIHEHGASKTPVFTNRDVVQYRQLMVWVYRVSKVNPPSQTETVEQQPASPLLQMLPGTDGSRQPPAPTPTGTPADDDESPSADLKPPKLVPPTAPSPTKVGKSPSEPKDPLDPEIFNRRFLPPE
jgi:hypothetical protein